MFNFRKETKKATNFTQGEDKSFEYELTNSMAVLKYKFQDDFHASVKLIPIIMVNGEAYMDEGYPMYDCSLDASNFTKPAKANSWLMHEIHRIGLDPEVFFGADSQICRSRDIYHSKDMNNDDYYVIVKHTEDSIFVTIRGCIYNVEFKKNELEENGFRKLDMNHA